MDQFAKVLLLFITITLIMTSANAQSSVVPAQRWSEPIQLVPLGEHGHFGVHVKLNYSEDALFILDTGTSISMIKRDVAEHLQLSILPYRKEHKQQIYEDGKPIARATAHSVQIGSMDIEDYIFRVIEPDRMIRIFGHNVVGIIGSDLFSLFAIYLNFQQHEMRYIQNGNVTKQALRAIKFEKSKSIQCYSKLDDNLLHVDVTANNSIKESLLIDTGANITAISSKTALSLHLDRFYSRSHCISWFGIFDGCESRLPEIQIGNYQITNIPVNWFEKSPDDYPNGIGLDFLINFQVLMDYPAKKLYLKLADKKPWDNDRRIQLHITK